MYWQEPTHTHDVTVNDSVVDMVFAIRCRELPVDHAHSLAKAIMVYLPWLREEIGAGIHSIHVAASGNGWMRPPRDDDLLFPSRRTKLRIRIPIEREADTRVLSSKLLKIDGHELAIGDARKKSLSALTTLFSRHMVVDATETEEAFLDRVAGNLKEMGVHPQKMLCGIENTINTPDRPLKTRSLMLAELRLEESAVLQTQGMGECRHLGCGLFIPHRGIAELKDT
ncbi:MAG: type I-MYXAN CRISPR-associated protein Cas6/Cmx6 [Gammaproteobacteria bacterium]|nr:type I-MYXAN CRISPR-associated protein Cas6/Cmx6 [Gammaproteobacteria bacterium]